MRSERKDRICSVARTLEVMGDPWGFLTVRPFFFGLRKFNDIRDHGAIPKKILSQRLKVLVDQGVLVRRKYQEHPARYEYGLTDKGRDLYLPAIALMRWGNRWMADGDRVPLVLRHRSCGHWFEALVVCSECGEELNIRDVAYRSGPGAGFQPRSASRRHRRSPSPEIYERGRACSVARALTVVSDRWLFLIMREACFGARRFDDFHQATAIARNILAERLQALVANGLLQRRCYSDHPERFEYCLTERGRSLYQPILALMAWGDRWMAGKKGPPLILTHKKCNHDFEPVAVCSHCRDLIDAREVTYQDGTHRLSSAACVHTTR